MIVLAVWSNRRAWGWILALLWTPCWLLADEGSAPDFNRDVRAILAEHCFKCHGPDPEHRQAGLRLDEGESARSFLGSGATAIVPGDPQASELVRRIDSTDPGDMMPPPGAMHRLSEEQKDVLRRWVAAGAEYAPHWAFLPPQPCPLPHVHATDWPQNPIDVFVLANLESRGLHPALPADRVTLLRRVSFDLIGLPPTPEEADAFVNDTSPNAYQRVVDRLLESPHYGERWARQWLDLARYADTNGYEEDKPRSIWPYRDWVINAINADIPFDQFTIEQLAGDMLPGANVQQRVATGFHRNSMLNTESGVDSLEYRFYSMVDRVNTTGAIWLGLTLGCAQCHTHKYDPIPHSDYYQLLALMDDTEELEIEVPQPDLVAQRDQLQQQINTLLKELPDQFPLPPAGAAEESPTDDEQSQRRLHLTQSFDEWRRTASQQAMHWKVLWPTRLAANIPVLTLLDDDSVLAIGDTTKHDEYDLDFTSDLQGITAIRLETLPHERLPAGGPGRLWYEGENGTFFLCEFSATADGTPVSVGRTHQTAGNAQLAVDDNPLTGWTFGGRQKLSSVAIFECATPLPSAELLNVKMMSELPQPCAIGRFRISVTTDPWPAELPTFPVEIENLLVMDDAALTQANLQQLMQYFLEATPHLAEQHQKIADLRSQMPAFPTTLVMEDLRPEHGRTTYFRRRGEFLQPGAEVKPGVLSIFPPLPASAHADQLARADQLAGADRLALARWLVSADNPLVGRVTMNRQWAAFFGSGLVRSLDDFGYQGTRPTHPELLDWLALELVRQKWSMKQMHRLIVTSATYQASSRVTPELTEKDPQNLWLARGPRHRLQAEQIRDTALVASGLLAPRIGGPSVYPPQPPGATEGPYTALNWEPSPGPDRYRRSLYTFIKRTQPFAMLNVFDAPEGRVCTVSREISQTPLQALTLLNDPTFVEAAQELGRLTTEFEGTTAERVVWMFRRCLTRYPTKVDRDAIGAFYTTTRQRLSDQSVPTDLAAPGATDPVEQAAWTAVARALLNLEEFITKD